MNTTLAEITARNERINQYVWHVRNYAETLHGTVDLRFVDVDEEERIQCVFSGILHIGDGFRIEKSTRVLARPLDGKAILSLARIAIRMVEEERVRNAVRWAADSVRGGIALGLTAEECVAELKSIGMAHPRWRRKIREMEGTG